jgi:large subunit ribosomal protein LP0
MVKLTPKQKLMAKKGKYFEKVQALLAKYNKAFVVHCDNVGSKQIAQIRIALRGPPGEEDVATMIMGKNTMMRKAFRAFLDKNADHPCANLIPYLVGNVGLIFTNSDLAKVSQIIQDNKREAPAKQGSTAPVQVIIPAGPTGADPSATSFFQALQIPTKIQKGQVEITADVTLLNVGDKVTASHAALLAKLGIKPFFYGMVIRQIYDDGAVFTPEVLAITDDVVVEKFLLGVRNIAALGLKIGFPTIASVPHSLSNALKLLVAIVCSDESITYKFEKAEPYLAYLADPSAFAAANAGPATSGGAAASGDAAAAVVEEEKPKEEEEDVAVGGFFGDEEDAW